jgi:hypothetical protein
MQHEATNRGGLAIQLLLVATLAAVLIQPGRAAADVSGHVRGVVLDHATKRPVSGATVSIPAYGQSVTSGPDGSFAFDEPLLTLDPYRRIRAVVTAPGWGRWTISGVPLYPNDTLNLRAELRAFDYDHQVLSPEERGGRPRTQAPNVAGGNTCSGWDYQSVPPPTIKVWLSEEDVSEEYDYFFYVTHVLPNEWIASWDEDSLGAGAIAAKTYAAYRAMSDHAYSEGEDCADVIDTVADQVFDPSWSHENTDQAVYAAMGSILYRDGGIFLSQYWAGAPDDPCAPVEDGQFAGRMSQWGTQTCALDGEVWPDITQTFYQDTNWRYVENLLLDSSAESEGDYAWEDVGTATREKGDNYHRKWHWVLEPPNGKTGILRQQPLFLGTEATSYHAEVAIKCPDTNDVRCSFTIRITVYEEDGTSHRQDLTDTKSRNGEWKLFTFDPEAYGYSHTEVRFAVRSEQTLEIDATVLWSSFGGP